MTRKKQTYSIDSKILDRICGHGRGWTFTPDTFLDLGNRATVGSSLSRHKKKGTIRQLARGIYDYPATHPQLGLLAPSIDAIAKALAGRDATRIQPSGAYAANLLGLSQQVPMKAVFLTDGPSRKVRIGNQEIILKRTTPRNMATAGKVSGLVIQALRHLGPSHVNDSMISQLRQQLNDKDKELLLKDIRYAPAWIGAMMRKVALSEDI